MSVVLHSQPRPAYSVRQMSKIWAHCKLANTTSAQTVRFLLRDAVSIARTMLSKDVCRPSVCPSVCHTPVLCRNGSTYHQTFFTVSSHTILVFFQYKRYGNTYFDEKALNARGYEKIAIFTNISLYLGNDTRYSQHANKKPYPNFWMVWFSMTLNYP